MTGELIKINGSWDVAEKLKEYAINPIWAEGLIFSDGEPADYGLPNLWTIISGEGYDVGRTVYERIANFTQNTRDIDVCTMHSLYSIAQMMDQDNVFSYDMKYPIALEHLMDILSINPDILLTEKYVLSNPTLSSIYTNYGQSYTTISSGELSGLDLTGDYLNDYLNEYPWDSSLSTINFAL